MIPPPPTTPPTSGPIVAVRWRDVHVLAVGAWIRAQFQEHHARGLDRGAPPPYRTRRRGGSRDWGSGPLVLRTADEQRRRMTAACPGWGRVELPQHSSRPRTPLSASRKS